MRTKVDHRVVLRQSPSQSLHALLQPHKRDANEACRASMSPTDDAKFAAALSRIGTMTDGFFAARHDPHANTALAGGPATSVCHCATSAAGSSNSAQLTQALPSHRSLEHEIAMSYSVWLQNFLNQILLGE